MPQVSIRYAGYRTHTGCRKHSHASVHSVCCMLCNAKHGAVVTWYILEKLRMGHFEWFVITLPNGGSMQCPSDMMLFTCKP
jgi:hypothetical protein